MALCSSPIQNLDQCYIDHCYAKYHGWRTSSFVEVEIKENDRGKPDYICARSVRSSEMGKGEKKRRRETGQGIQCGLQGCLFEVLEDLEKYRLGMSPISFCCRYAICSWIKRFRERVDPKICDRYSKRRVEEFVKYSQAYSLASSVILYVTSLT
ncbi:hypothetical protein M0804_000732 [Polistes exclamans]|nr:hypothetical protein M0804_000732 [Polistes exclamans]